MNNNPEQLLELALKAGASHAEVYQSSACSHPVFFEANRLKQLESSESEGVALRLWRSRCPGLAVAYGAVDPTALVEKALALAALNEPETIDLAEPHQVIYPRCGEFVSVEHLIELGKEAISYLRSHYSEIVCSGQLDCEETRVCLVNSQGLHLEYTDLATSYYLGVEWVRGEDFLSIYDGEYTQGKINLRSTLEQICQRLDWARNPANAPRGQVPVILTANAAGLLWSTVEEALNGQQVLEKSSPWSEKTGEKVIFEGLSISQDPSLDPYSCPFDDEGSLTQSLNLIEGGYLKEFYLDRHCARKLGRKTTGNGFRGSLGRYPSPELVNMIISSGDRSLEELLSQIRSGLIVDQILGGGADISGDFSINVDLGYAIENGQIVGRVKDTMVSGNVYQALKQVKEIGSDRRWQGSCYTPSLTVEGLSVVTSL